MTPLKIRQALSARGYALDTPAGLVGAVKAFQTASGLKSDGDPGPMTQAALRAPIPARPVVVVPAGGIAALLTVARLRRFEPFARADILAGIAGSAAAIQAAGITTPLRLAHFLAQVSVESGGLAKLEEGLSYSASRLVEVWPNRLPTVAAATPYARNPKALAIKVYGGRLGNKASPSTDGWDFRGSGGLQTTGRANFAELGADANPDRLRTPDGFLAPALHYWNSRGCNALADRDDVVGISVKINGGTNGLSDRKARLAAAKRVFA
ncbi:peptidoglycan-binding protein [Methylobacterium sp. E-041]|uniref:peptidoglycan-binding protein n=1 Tax=Methylobacterium sp. E-041 TaxID=2836573 RepID=UPI001FB8CC04|nr:peptidoglycan-binding protein [Methylobacterium sp. E-041]MCJ2108014.1 peptidoglycan-binding protein [Methylobacterium sp. E-041]